MPPNFTGRAAEQKMLDDWLADNTNRLFILRALGGFGKSALAWQWINNHVNPAEWTKLVWWSFYEGDASFEHFIEETLKYLKLEVPQGQRPQVDELLKAMQSQKILLIMDGFERVLRLYASMNAAYQDESEQKIEDDQLACKDIYAEWFLRGICSLPSMKGKVLMTTRLTPRAVKPREEFMLGCHEEELAAMQQADAVEFFQRQKIKGIHTEIEAACAPYGYHPLTLRILAGLIINDREIPYDVGATKKIDLTDDIIQNKNHVLEISYSSLSADQKKLLGIIACFRSSITYSVLKKVSGFPFRKRRSNKSTPNLGNDLQVLETHGLLLWDKARNKYNLHPIVRRYVHKHLSPTERTITHGYLRDYFATFDIQTKPKTLADLEPLIERYYHATWAEDYEQAYTLLSKHLAGNLYFQFGANQLLIELDSRLFMEDEYKNPKLKNGTQNAWLYNSLANSYCNIGKPLLAIELFEADISISRENNSKEIIAPISNMAIQQIYIGSLQSSTGNLNNVILFGKEISDIFNEAIGLAEMGRLLSYRGLWSKSEESSLAAQALFDQFGIKATNYVSVNIRRRSLHYLLKGRDSGQFSDENLTQAIEYAKQSLKLTEERALILHPIEIDFVCSYWLLGASYRLNQQFEFAEYHLAQALKRCRSINYVLDEADILLDLARLRYDQKNYAEAKSLAEEALSITERCGYVLQGADVNLFLAQYALEQEQDKVKAKEYAETALKLATCDGPPYYYKVAYEEAERFLEKLK